MSFNALLSMVNPELSVLDINQHILRAGRSVPVSQQTVNSHVGQVI